MPDIIVYDKVSQCLAVGRWFSPGTFVSFNNKNDITEIVLKVTLSTIIPNLVNKGR